MNCNKCGKENENGSLTCAFCGASLEGFSINTNIVTGVPENLSKKEYFKKYSSALAKKRIAASWWVWAVSAVLFVALTIFLMCNTANFFETGGIAPGTKLQESTIRIEGIKDIFNIMTEPNNLVQLAISRLVVIYMTITGLLSVIFALTACIRRDTATAITAIVLSVLSFSITFPVVLAAAISIYVLNKKLNLEYKAYQKKP